VNVHPQKAEVRFTDARGVFEAITRELHSALGAAYRLPDLGGNPFARSSAPPAGARLSEVTSSVEARRAAATLEPPPMTVDRGALTLEPPATLPRDREPASSPLPERNLFLPVDPANVLALADSATPELFQRPGVYASLRFVGQVRATFLLCEGEDGVYVLDQHAAAERVTFDRLRRAHASREMPTQKLLVPEVVELPAADVSVLEEYADEVLRLGVEIRAVGASAVAVHAMPALLSRATPARVVRDLASELSREGGRAFRGAVDLVLATMACHGSVRAGDAIAPAEATALLAALDRVDFAGHCPHGRPIVMRLAWGELERRVGR
jgi:DNA mismatch repair protein MutL